MSWIPTLTLFCMMLALGMTLRLGDFGRLWTAQAAVWIGVFGQLVLLPTVVFAIAHLFALSPQHALGLALIAACPGGVVSNVLTRLARGDVALSISLTAVSSVCSFVSVPFVMQLAMQHFGATGPRVELSFAEMATPLFSTTALPVLLGMATLHWRPGLAARVQRPLLGVSTGILLLLIVGLATSLAGQAEALSLGSLFRAVTPAVVALVAVMTGAGLLVPRAFGLDAATSRTLALEVGLQNFNLALVVALSMFGEPRYAGPALVYLPVMFVFAAAIIGLQDRTARPPERQGRSPARPAEVRSKTVG